MLRIDNVTKEFRRRDIVKANDGVTLSVEPGEVFGLLGPNGAGKTTLVRQVVGLTRPDSGSIHIGATDVLREPEVARAACSWQPQSAVPINSLTPLQAIEMVGRIRGASRADARQRAGELLEALGITDWSAKRGATLSGGVARLVAFAMAAVVPGKVVILDEPTNDVDPLRRRLLWQEVTALAAAGSAVLLVTHNVLEAERVVNRLAVLDGGRVVASGTPGSLKLDSLAGFRLELIVEPDVDTPELPAFVRRPLVTGRRVLADVASDDVELAVRWAREARDRGQVEEFSLGPTTLEDVYVRLVEPKTPEPGTEVAA